MGVLSLAGLALLPFEPTAGGGDEKLGPSPDWPPRLLYFIQTIIIAIYHSYGVQWGMAYRLHSYSIRSIILSCQGGIHSQAIISRAGAIVVPSFLRLLPVQFRSVALFARLKLAIWMT
jgi:hypothetical protein